jgi:3-hydroxybutyryl-CoA dehydrogenase
MIGAGFKMGPFELMDLIGIDINFAVTKSVFEAFFGEPRYRPHPIQQRMVESGAIGRKAGRGFYDYSTGEKGDVAYRASAAALGMAGGSLPGAEKVDAFTEAAGVQVAVGRDVVTRILAMIINEAAFALGEGVASAADIDTAMKLGTNYPHGPLEWADRIGLQLVVDVLRSLQASLGEERYRPAPLLLRMVESVAAGAPSGRGFRVGTDGMV